MRRLAAKDHGQPRRKAARLVSMGKRTTQRGPAISRILPFVLVFCLTTFSAWAAGQEDRLYTGHALLSNWQVDEASDLAKTLEEEDASDPASAYFLGRVYFERGEYEKALDYLNGAGDYRISDRRHPGALDYAPYLKAAYENTKDIESKRSEHFEVRVSPGPDEVLMDGALETLEKAYEALGQDLGYKPKNRVIVEFYPRLEQLAAATGVTVEALKTSGTIAICKWSRLMLTSPRVAALGYSWRDTLNHEYAHLIMSRATANTLPLWMHEGLAKFLEERWRNPPGGELDASSQNLLVRALRENKLVTLEQISPSMAYLPSQQHAALAFAEVLTMVQWLYGQRGGSEGIRRLLQAVKETRGDSDESLRRVYGLDLSSLQVNWRSWARQLRERPADDFDDYSILFGDKDGQDEEKALQKLQRKSGRNMITLGKLLKDRKHYQAAVVEFRKAELSLGRANPLLANYLADCLITLDDYAGAWESLKPAVQLSPHWAPSRIRAGLALTKLSQWDEAVRQLEAAEAVNPFDPRVQALLAEAYDKLGQTDKASRAERNLRLVSQGR